MLPVWDKTHIFCALLLISDSLFCCLCTNAMRILWINIQIECVTVIGFVNTVNCNLRSCLSWLCHLFGFPIRLLLLDLLRKMWFILSGPLSIPLCNDTPHSAVFLSTPLLITPFTFHFHYLGSNSFHIHSVNTNWKSKKVWEVGRPGPQHWLRACKVAYKWFVNVATHKFIVVTLSSLYQDIFVRMTNW